MPVPEKRELPIWWTCGLPGCSHPTREGATFHGMLMERGLPQMITKPSAESLYLAKSPHKLPERKSNNA
jgi:hypothetical protein